MYITHFLKLTNNMAKIKVKNPVVELDGDENYLVSPADGKISMITECNGPKEIGMEEKS